MSAFGKTKLLREAGMFEAPPGMVQSVSKVVLEAWVSRIKHGITGHLEMWRKKLQMARAAPNPNAAEIASFESFIVDLSLLNSRLSREYPRVQPKKVPSEGGELTRLPYDLKGWKYKPRFDELVDRLSDKDRRLLFSFELNYVDVSVVFAQSDLKGTWWGWGLLRLWCDPNLQDYDTFRERRAEYLRTIRHELQHLGQTILSKVIRRVYHKDRPGVSEEAGMPPRHVREREHDTSGYRHKQRREEKNRIEHARRDEEFYTRLQDEIVKARNLWRVVPRKYRPWAVDRIVGVAKVPRFRGPESEETMRRNREQIKERYRYTDNDLHVLRDLRGYVSSSPFFSALKRGNVSKWRKAVAEFAKAVR